MAVRRTGQSVSSWLRGQTMLNNTARHQLKRGNVLGSHNQVYRQIRRSMGLTSG